METKYKDKPHCFDIGCSDKATRCDVIECPLLKKPKKELPTYKEILRTVQIFLMPAVVKYEDATYLPAVKLAKAIHDRVHGIKE